MIIVGATDAGDGDIIEFSYDNMNHSGRVDRMKWAADPETCEMRWHCRLEGSYANILAWQRKLDWIRITNVTIWSRFGTY